MMKLILAFLWKRTSERALKLIVEAAHHLTVDDLENVVITLGRRFHDRIQAGEK